MSLITVYRGSGTGMEKVTAITNASSPYTVLTTDQTITADVTSGNITINLLDPTVAANRHVLKIIVIGTNFTNTVTLSTSTGVIAVGGASTFVLQTPGTTLWLVPDGTNWQVLGGL